jgi:hypothetical protein
MQSPKKTSTQNNSMGNQRGVVKRSSKVGSGGEGRWLGGIGALGRTAPMKGFSCVPR